jgi:hypothetical protein
MGTVSKEGKNIEGAEYDVIFNARKESLRRIKRLMGEIHYEGKEMLENFGEYPSSIASLGF